MGEHVLARNVKNILKKYIEICFLSFLLLVFFNCFAESILNKFSLHENGLMFFTRSLSSSPPSCCFFLPLFFCFFFLKLSSWLVLRGKLCSTHTRGFIYPCIHTHTSRDRSRYRNTWRLRWCRSSCVGGHFISRASTKNRPVENRYRGCVT